MIDSRAKLSRPFSSHGRYQNILDEHEPDYISLSAFDADSESESSSVNICELGEIRPLLSEADVKEPDEREPRRYFANFKRYLSQPSGPSLKYEVISHLYPPVHVDVSYSPKEKLVPNIPTIRINRVSTDEQDVNSTLPFKPIIPIDSLELIHGSCKNASPLIGRFSPPHIVETDQSVSSIDEDRNDIDAVESGLARNASQLIIGQTTSMLSISQSVPSIAAIQQIADNLMLLRQETNENLRKKTSKREVVPVVTSFITNLLAHSEEQLRHEDSYGQKISMVDLLQAETENKGNMNCGYDSPRRDCVSDLDEIQRFDLLPDNYLVLQY